MSRTVSDSDSPSRSDPNGHPQGPTLSFNTVKSPPLWYQFLEAPLGPVAITVLIGLITERYAHPSFSFWTVSTFGALLAWAVSFYRKAASAALWLCVASACLGGGYLHLQTRLFSVNDIGEWAGEPYVIARVRGEIVSEPTWRRAPPADPLISLPRTESTLATVAVREIWSGYRWQPTTGRVRLLVEGHLDQIHLGDEIEATGQLRRPSSAANPGETDNRRRLLDQRITAELRLPGKSPPIRRLQEGWQTSFWGWLAFIRAQAQEKLLNALAEPEKGVAAALLLGEGSTMDRQEWDAFIRTGVVHILAISGQHLVILAGFLWLVLRVSGVRRTRGAVMVAGAMIFYALLTGGRPSAMRAAVMVSVFCGGLILRRPSQPANAFAAAFLVVVALDPTDPFTPGCQLSFLSVFVLIWFIAPLNAQLHRIRSEDPIRKLIELSRPQWEKRLRRLGRAILSAYLVSIVLGVANAPLILYWQNIVAPAGMLLTPPLILLTAIALISGFLFLLIGTLLPLFGTLCLALLDFSLKASSGIVHYVDQFSLAVFYSPSPSTLWLAGFYLLMVSGILVNPSWKPKVLALLMIWIICGLALPPYRPSSGELRATFLAVGHGGCVVLETPGKHVLLYDAGAITGPDIVRNRIAPFLWHWGISRIDEIFLSHADVDHFNALPELVRRFRVGMVTLTPSFADRPSPAAKSVLQDLTRRKVPQRVTCRGERFYSGPVELEVLHPPAFGPDGVENARSMVLAVRHCGHTILLTGDLEAEGLSMVQSLPAPKIDVLLAPHHGSRNSNTPAFARWAKPKVVISSQRATDTKTLRKVYEAEGAIVYDTASHGAVTVRSHSTGLTLETFLASDRRVIHDGRMIADR